jgi:E3 ubiquitin-protein ligase NEDD4
VLWVSRASAFDDWAAWAARHSEGAWRRPMWKHLRLVEAPTSMGSGVERETLELMAGCLAAGGLLTPTAEGGRALAAPPGPLTPARRQSLVAVGWLLGYCLLHERTLPLPLEAPFLRALLGRRATGLAELEGVDPVFHRSLTMMLDSPGAADLCLTFTVEEGGQQIELVPGGDAIAVTDANKAQFAAAVADWKLSLRSAAASAAVREGLNDVVPSELLRIFHEGDLALLLGGAAEVDIADWRAHTLYDGFDRSEPLVSWFWQCVGAMSREERALLLKLATGASRVPPAGFAALQGLAGPHQFTLMRVDSELTRLPTASTCFNTLKCPRYASFQQLERKLLAAVRFGAGGFEFV